MKWCLAAGLFPPAIGGPATHAWDLAHALHRRGEAVTVVAGWGVTKAACVVRDMASDAELVRARQREAGQRNLPSDGAFVRTLLRL